jgi:hypothetical protein
LRAVVRRSIEQGENRADLSVLEDCYATDYVHHNPDNPVVEAWWSNDLFGMLQQIGAAFDDQSHGLVLQALPAVSSQAGTRTAAHRSAGRKGEECQVTSPLS